VPQVELPPSHIAGHTDRFIKQVRLSFVQSAALALGDLSQSASSLHRGSIHVLFVELLNDDIVYDCGETACAGEPAVFPGCAI